MATTVFDHQWNNIVANIKQAFDIGINHAFPVVK